MSALRKWGKTTALLAAFAMLGLTQIGCDQLIEDLVEDTCLDACQTACDAMDLAEPGSCEAEGYLDDCNENCDVL